MKSINDLTTEAFETASAKGWHEKPLEFGTRIALMHSELSEALEEYRNNKGINFTYYEGEKPVGVPIELADVVIRIFNTCATYGIDLEEAIDVKMAYNKLRPYKHGGKKI